MAADTFREWLVSTGHDSYPIFAVESMRAAWDAAVVWQRARQNTKVGTPSASHNTRIAQCRHRDVFEGPNTGIRICRDCRTVL